MKKNIFKYLRKKILEQSQITEEIDEIFHVYKIECLGFTEIVTIPAEYPAMEIAKGLLVDRLVENSDFMKKLEQVETRKSNLKSLLD